MNQLNAYMALEIMHDSMERAERQRRARPPRQQPPAPRYDAVTIAPHPGGRPLATPRLRRALAVLRRAPATLRN